MTADIVSLRPAVVTGRDGLSEYNCQYCGGPHGDDIEIVENGRRAILSLHPACEPKYMAKFRGRIILRDF